MMGKVPLMLLIFIPSLQVEGVSPITASERPVFVKEGEMVVLCCRARKQPKDANVTWTGPAITQETDVTSNKSKAGETPTSVLFHERNLVILNASVNHQGNYFCSVGNTSSPVWFNLTVLARQSQSEKMSWYSKTCSEQESCKLKCPDPLHIPNLTSKGVIWYKDGQSAPASFEERYYFESVDEKDSGVYSCVRCYLYHGRLCSMTRTTELEVETNEHSGQNPVIISPYANQVFHVDLDSPVVIDCVALMYLDLDEVFWLYENSIVEMNDSLPVYYNYTRKESGDEIKMTASLVFQKVSKEDLSKHYTCKLESPTCQLDPPSYSSCNVTISLAQKAHPSPFCIALWIVGILVVMALSVVIYVKFKIEIVLFLRDTLGCYSNSSDGKCYDAYLMYYNGETGAGLRGSDRKWLENVLEERFGYNICLYDRDVLPGKAAAEAVLECIEQSRTLVLIPTSGDSAQGSGLLSAIHEARVERQIHLVLITTETSVESGSTGSVPEALQHLGRAVHSVTWKGLSSWPPSSSFWKQLRYHLPAPQRSDKMDLNTYTHPRY